MPLMVMVTSTMSMESHMWNNLMLMSLSLCAKGGFVTILFGFFAAEGCLVSCELTLGRHDVVVIVVVAWVGVFQDVLVAVVESAKAVIIANCRSHK
jgi:hypothetical protein